jgi:hypothetical protein
LGCRAKERERDVSGKKNAVSEDGSRFCGESRYALLCSSAEHSKLHEPSLCLYWTNAFSCLRKAPIICRYYQIS